MAQLSDAPIILYLAVTEDGNTMKVGGTKNLGLRMLSLPKESQRLYGSRTTLLRAVRATRREERQLKVLACTSSREWSPATADALADANRFMDRLPAVDTSDAQLRSDARLATLRTIGQNDPRTEQVLLLRAEGNTLRQIGDAVGVTGEYIRQILKSRGITGYLPKPPKPQEWPIKGFLTRMRKCLQGSGWRYCSACKTWLCAAAFSPNTRRCRKCNATQQRALYQNSAKYREAQKRWQQTHPENLRAMALRWRDKHPLTPEKREEARARAKAKYALLASTPEGREKICAYARARYACAVSTPEGREKLRLAARAKYARRKAKANNPDA